MQALELRIAGGTYRQIAEQLGVDVKTAYHDVHDELERLDAVKKERAEKLRELDLARLDRATLALGRKIQAGDERAIMAMVRIMERRARLAGLDQAVEHKHEQVGEWSMRWKTRDEK